MTDATKNPVIDVNAIRAAAEGELREERVKKATEALKRQLRVVDAAKEVVRAEELKLADLEAQINDGTL